MRNPCSSLQPVNATPLGPLVMGAKSVTFLAVPLDKISFFFHHWTTGSD